MSKYDNATDEELDECLKEIVSRLNTEQILSYGEVYSFFKEEFNNEILDLWEQKHSVTLHSIQKEYQDKFRGRKTQYEFRDYYVPILAKRIQNEAEFDSFEISGPFGLNCNYLIEFKKGDDNYYFSFYEQNLDGEIGIHKEKGDILDFEYKPGTVGYYNQGNMDHVKLHGHTKISEIIEKYIVKEK